MATLAEVAALLAVPPVLLDRQVTREDHAESQAPRRAATRLEWELLTSQASERSPDESLVVSQILTHGGLHGHFDTQVSSGPESPAPAPRGSLEQQPQPRRVLDALLLNNQVPASASGWHAATAKMYCDDSGLASAHLNTLSTPAPWPGGQAAAHPVEPGGLDTSGVLAGSPTPTADKPQGGASSDTRQTAHACAVSRMASEAALQPSAPSASSPEARAVDLAFMQSGYNHGALRDISLPAAVARR
jgi:hypothetical protein